VLPSRSASRGAVASSSAVSTRTAWCVVTVAFDASSSGPACCSGRSEPTRSPVSASVALLMPETSNMARPMLPKEWVPPLRNASGSVDDVVSVPPWNSERRLNGTVRLLSTARSSGPARVARPPAPTARRVSKVIGVLVSDSRGSLVVRVRASPARRK
jgi:hypothetical protein